MTHQTTNESNPAQLFQSIAEAMEAVERIPKTGYNDFHKYHFATEADVSDAIRKELAARHVAVFVGNQITNVREWQTPKGKPTLITNVECTITFACGKTGATHTITASGTGDDPSDKGTYKAITGAVKYALLKTFLVPTGDDPEQVAEHQRESAAALDAAFASATQQQNRPVSVPTPNPAPVWPDTPATPDKGIEAAQKAFDAVLTTPTPAAEEYTFAFGKYKGQSIRDVPDNYLDWLLKQSGKEGYEAKTAEQHAIYRRELHRREQEAVTA